MQENDVRPEPELAPDPVPAIHTKSAMDEAKANFSRACTEAGRIYYEIDTLKGSLGEAIVRARNANLSYHKMKTAETKQHLAEATITDKEVTQ